MEYISDCSSGIITQHEHLWTTRKATSDVMPSHHQMSED